MEGGTESLLLTAHLSPLPAGLTLSRFSSCCTHILPTSTSCIVRPSRGSIHILNFLNGLRAVFTIVLYQLREMVMDREARRAAVHGVAESDMTEQLNDNSFSNPVPTQGEPD